MENVISYLEEKKFNVDKLIDMTYLTYLIYLFDCVKTPSYGNSEKLIKNNAKSHHKNC